MTVFLRALWGPFHRETDMRVARFGGHVIPATQIDWHFFGIREDNTMGRWTLRFRLSDRKYQIINYPMSDKPADPALVDTFVPDQPMIHGPTYLAVLKQRLSADDIAFASRLALEHARR